MKIILKAAKLVATTYGNDIAFGQVALHDDNGKWIRNLKIDDATLALVKSGATTIEIEDDLFSNP